MLANPDFVGHFDYVPYEEFESPGNTCYSDGMSGKWAYRVAVSTQLRYLLGFLIPPHRLKLQKTQTPTTPCSSR